MSQFIVNGKEPIAAWIPSLDDAGNGTTTLTDLTGNGNDGVLTNMDPSTDWVADTDAGGVRALDFDGVNDNVEMPPIGITGSQSRTVSVWAKPDSNGNFIWVSWGGTSSSRGSLFTLRDSRLAFAINGAVVSSEIVSAPVGQWSHFAMTYASGGTLLDAVFYFNGVELAGGGNINGGRVPNTDGSLPLFVGQAPNGNDRVNGLIDDVRVFEVDMQQPDIDYLYSNGQGRGVVSAVLPINVFRNPVFDNPTFRGSTLR